MEQMAGPRPPDVSIGYRLLVGTTVTFVCAFIVVSLRGVARSLYARMSWDDYLTIFALVQALIATIFDCIAVDKGLGCHLIYIPKNDAVTAMYYDLLSQVFCINALSFAKISICLSYLRILKGSRHTVLRVICYLTAFLVFVVNTVVTISLTGVFATIRTIESGLGLKNGISDASYTTVMGLMWAGMERNIAMMIGSVPALRPLTTPFMKLTSETMSYLGIRSSSKTQSSSGVNGSGSFPNRSGNKSTKHLPTTSMVMVAMSEKQTRCLYELGRSRARASKDYRQHVSGYNLRLPCMTNVDGLLSTRGGLNVTQVLGRIPSHVLNPALHRDEIDLSMAENQLAKVAIETILYYEGFFGDATLLDLLASTVNTHFRSHSQVAADNIAVTAGAAAGLDAILYNICNPGDGVLVPCPYWNGYDALFALHSGVRPVGVVVPSLEDSFGPALLSALEESYEKASCPIRALVLANPHNPLGRPYSRLILEQCMAFCQRRNIHLVSDEAFAFSSFTSPDFTNPEPFISCLSIDPSRVGCDPQRIHVVWSMSKDLSASGVRLVRSQLPLFLLPWINSRGCVITRNRPLRDVVGLVASVHVSVLSTVFAKEVLASPQLPKLLTLSATRLAKAYSTLTTAFKATGIEYFPSYATVFVLARLAPNATAWDEEMLALRAYMQAGVAVAPGRAYHMAERQKGWMRVTFAVSNEDLSEGIRRTKTVYVSLLAGGVIL
ncbi:1-aminocyclopropane-1-carboxylate [Aspergillus oryzae 100-8]|uniref:1-aminocyclopropane-1-carboxylate synthase n=1 Tax=Aspergillus oryzae (strain 3.042) TaxID=1160506 RepID=I8TMN5_ASPO3|nr:1-aminocyclopropane-1-carboxylate synthase [Aspergillus oryzae 3.042]KDE81244.1 1-aminocyclopropane-1-carboxylate [Aspergillus oryzae 100-8]|eukprot:EIT75178.1 1-aminocyclopropane-1-carboxylate synthase [Aspergillus oryzae 3.042]